MNILLWCISGFLMIAGLATVWEWLLLYLNRPKWPLLRYEVVPVSGTAEEMEQQLRYLLLTRGARQLILLDGGLDEEGKELCGRFCRESGFLLLQEKELASAIFPENDLEDVANP